MNCSNALIAVTIDLAERGWLPDPLLRLGMRRLCARRLVELEHASADDLLSREAAFAEECRRGPIAPVPEKANQQHYEVPAEFFEWVLGPRKKYSSCLWPAGCDSLAKAEEHALGETCQRAEIADGMSVLELGCGWGSLTLWLAEHYPHVRVTALSNSASQREFIERAARERGLADRVQVITADINAFQARERYDRVVSVEMFEHLRNYERLLAKVTEWLADDGKLFVHIFCHRKLAYSFETDGAENWMGRHFFTGGIMPSAGFFRQFSRDLTISRQWSWNGQHYAKTADAWVANLDRHRGRLLPILARIYGPADAARWFYRWRMLFLAGAELFGYRGGEEWFVSHYLLAPTPARRRGAALLA